MMLLLGTGSLVGISSMYTPANVETQPQPQPQKPQTPLQGGIITPRGGLGSAQDVADQKRIMQAIQDKQLLDRLMPQIIKRIDISASVVSRDGPQGVSKGTGPISSTTLPASSVARCNTGEIPVSGGFAFWSDPADSFVNNNGLYQRENGWVAGARMGDEGSIKASVTCLTVKVGLKNAQQPQPQQPSPPPGGPPLQPPPEFGRK